MGALTCTSIIDWPDILTVEGFVRSDGKFSGMSITELDGTLSVLGVVTGGGVISVGVETFTAPVIGIKIHHDDNGINGIRFFSDECTCLD